MTSRHDWIRDAERVLPALLGVALLIGISGFFFIELDVVLPTSLAHLAHPGEAVVGIAVLLATFGVFLWLLLPSRRVRPESAGREAWICPNCLHAYVPGAHFCPHCSAPVDEFAARGGYERVYASAWVIGKAVRRPTRRLHVGGISLIALPAVFTSVWTLSLGPRSLGLASGMIWIVGAFYLALLLVAWRNLRRGRQPAGEYGAPPSWTFDSEWGLEPDGTLGPGRGADGMSDGAAPVG